MKPHPLDRAIALMSRRSRLFSRGWGEPTILAEFADRNRYLARPGPIAMEWSAPRTERTRLVRDGKFRSPLAELPPPVAMAHVRGWTKEGNQTACVMPAASRDEGYWIREKTFLPLTESGIDLYFLENPYYGRRRNARGPSDISVADQGLMALGMVLESRALLEYLQPRYGKLAVAGYSMGGHMAALTAAVVPFPLACAALATGASASAIYTRGLLSWSVDFATLGDGARARLKKLFDVADLANYRPPIRVDATVISGCTRDGYVLADETERLHRLWKNSTLRWIEAGHFSALFTQAEALRGCVQEAVEKL